MFSSFDTAKTLTVSNGLVPSTRAVITVWVRLLQGYMKRSIVANQRSSLDHCDTGVFNNSAVSFVSRDAKNVGDVDQVHNWDCLRRIMTRPSLLAARRAFHSVGAAAVGTLKQIIEVAWALVLGMRAKVVD